MVERYTKGFIETVVEMKFNKTKTMREYKTGKCVECWAEDHATGRKDHATGRKDLGALGRYF